MYIYIYIYIYIYREREFSPVLPLCQVSHSFLSLIFYQVVAQKAREIKTGGALPTIYILAGREQQSITLHFWKQVRYLKESIRFHIRLGYFGSAYIIWRCEQKPLRKSIASDSLVLVHFDEIGLAEASPNNPLKVLHAHLEPGYPKDRPET